MTRKSKTAPRYDPNKRPDAKRWLAMPEEERQALVARHHRQANCEHAPGEGPPLHDLIHLLVENQAAAGGATPVAAALERLTGEGLTRHQAVHAVGSVLSEMIYGAVRGGGSKRGFEPYYEKIRALTAASWRREHGRR